MRRRDRRLAPLALACALGGAGCGGSLYDAPPQPKDGEPFVAKGKLRSEGAANAALKKVGKSAPAR
jgi:hypothetical protein